MTDVALKEFLERRIDDLAERMTQRFVLADYAIAKAEQSMEKRLDGMNEFRNALTDQATKMASRESVDSLRDAMNQMDKRVAVQSAMIGFIVSLVTSLLGLILHWAVR